MKVKKKGHKDGVWGSEGVSEDSATVELKVTRKDPFQMCFFNYFFKMDLGVHMFV